MPYDKERLAAVNAVLKASSIARNVQQSLISADTIVKKDNSPVTIADFAVQAVVSAELARDLPGDVMMAEENASQLRETANAGVLESVLKHARSAYPGFDSNGVISAIDRCNHNGGATGRFWTLDPIDGTKGFLRREQCAIALALIEDGRVVLGVLGCPNLHKTWDDGRGTIGRLFVAVRGEGAFERGLDDDPTEWVIRVDENDPQNSAFCESVESGHTSHDSASRIAVKLGVTRPPVRMDSQCKYGVVARGEASIYLRLPKEKPVGPNRYVERIWDHAAGAIVIEEAGGRVTDIYGKPLEFSHGRGLEANDGVIATNGKLHDRLLKIVSEVMEF